MNEEFNKLIYNTELQNAFETAKEPFYIGFGNPGAKILIIGQENAIDSETQEARAKAEIENNHTQWKEILAGNECYSEWSENKVYFKFNPRYGYQWSDRETEGYQDILTESQDGRTSKDKVVMSGTWRHYKRLLDMLLPKIKKGFKPNAGKFDIFDHCFMSELSARCALNHKETKGKAPNGRTTKQSIETRRELWKQSFFQQKFKLVIIAAGRYDETYKINFKDLFKDADKVIVTPQLSTQQFVRLESIVAAYQHDPHQYIDLRESFIAEPATNLMILPVEINGEQKNVVYASQINNKATT